jgi:hypothetical protein
MTPNVDERLASIVRALSEVILPHLPPEASLAQEQVHLCIGHLQILRAQFDAVPAFEREELDDAIAVARDLAGAVTGGEQTTAALSAMNAAVDAADGGDVRGQRAAVLEAVDALVKAVSADGSSNAKAALPGVILKHETPRTLKDRQWFAPFGFDTL